MMDPDALFAALNEASVDYVVVGGLAANLRGSQRVTKDIDIVYSTEPTNLRKLCAVINAIEPRIIVLGQPEGSRLTLTPQHLKRYPLLQLSTKFGEVDLLSAIAGFKSYDAIKKASNTVDVDGRSIPMLTLAGVIKSKRALKRPKDIDDIHQLEAVAELEHIEER